MHLAHSHPLGGHLRACNILEKQRDLFHWPGMKAEVWKSVSKLMSDLFQLLQVKQIQMAVYHLQTDGLDKRFNQMPKTMLWQVVDKEGRNCDLLLPYVMFVVHKTPQVPTGFIPFELLFGKRLQGLLDMASCETTHGGSTSRTETIFNRPSQHHEFQPGQPACSS